jgi:opacity protein-like surface antigen
MNNVHRSLIISSICSAGAFAGETYVPAPAPEPAPVYSTGNWFAGGGVDYLFDAEDVYLNGHFGYEWGGGSSFFVEVGWAEYDEDIYDPYFVLPEPYGGSTAPGLGVGEGAAAPGILIPVGIDVVPITANYKYEVPFGGSVSFYIGGGLGVSYLDMSVGAFSDDDWTFTAQAFTGLVFNVSESFEVYTGLRYLWMDDSSLYGANISDLDDFAAGVGLRFNF